MEISLNIPTLSILLLGTAVVSFFIEAACMERAMDKRQKEEQSERDENAESY